MEKVCATCNWYYETHNCLFSMCRKGKGDIDVNHSCELWEAAK